MNNNILESILLRAKNAKAKLLSQGSVYAPPFGWQHTDCLAYGLKIGAIVKTTHGYSLLAELRVEEKIAGYRGRTPITERKEFRDLSKIKAFFEYCDEWNRRLKELEKELDEETKELMKSLF